MKYPCTHQLTEVTWPIPMLPSHQFKPYANKMKMKKDKITTSPADPINPYFGTQSLIKDLHRYSMLSYIRKGQTTCWA